ncbi:MAG TPA: hypothetical protein VF097_00275, partial [Actinomycetota bacterium]
FWAKFQIFAVAIVADQAYLAVAVVVNSVISLYYYFSIVRQMFFVEGLEERPFRASALVTGVVALAAVAIVVVGIFPDLFAGFPDRLSVP